MATWLPIIEYSIKTGISVSTIRRKIKNKGLKHRTENGKYLILDENTDYEISLDKNNLLNIGSENRKFSTLSNIDELIFFAEKSINRISELNKDVIKEKDRIIKVQENHIMKLSEQIDELKMLVSILEKNPVRRS
jgi:hypothetical protein